MSNSLRFFSISFLILLIIMILYLLRKDKITIKYSIVWLTPCFILLIFTIIPGCLTWTTNIFGFQTASNMIFAMLVALLMIITIVLTVIVSNQKNQIRNLIQEVSILKNKIDKE
jgi:hypothetical protein